MKLKPKKKFGQHFLTNKLIAKKIVDNLNNTPSHLILEIGPGEGALTQFLIEKKNKIKLIEIDEEAIKILRIKFPQIDIIHDDFLKYDLTKSGNKKYIIVGNFPYNISTQILFKILNSRDLVDEVVGMFQKEVADRICSAPNSKKYGIPSVLLQAFFNCQQLFDVSANNFDPKPKVNSSVIKLTRNNKCDLGCDYKQFIQVVKSSFSQRRKKIKNALKNFTNLNDQRISQMITKRAEELSVKDFIELTNTIKLK